MTSITGLHFFNRRVFRMERDLHYMTSVNMELNRIEFWNVIIQDNASTREIIHQINMPINFKKVEGSERWKKRT